MVVEAERLPFERLARLAERLAAGVPAGQALELVARAAVETLPLELAIVRVLDERDGMLVARAVAPADSALAAEVSGSRVDASLEPAADRLLVPARAGARLVGALELIGPFEAPQLAIAELLAAQLALVLAHAPGVAANGGLAALRRTGEALAAGAEPERTARQALREAILATGASHGAIWRAAGEELEPLASEGPWPEGA